MYQIDKPNSYEKPIKYAPEIELCSGEKCIPQHFLLYQHTLESVEELIAEIEYDDNYPVFVCEDKGGIYIQVGIIGYDNYLPIETQSQLKIVYGRKWRVEQQLPTSEIIQTVFLAIKTAREHEVRESFRLDHGEKKSTPFNNHHDLPLMASKREFFKQPTKICEDKEAINQALKGVIYDNTNFVCHMLTQHHSDQWLIDLSIRPSDKSRLPELTNFTLMLDSLDESHIWYQLMDNLIRMSNRHVEENFRYNGFARFSHDNNIRVVGTLSAMLRDSDHLMKNKEFNHCLSQANYQTDSTRVPMLNDKANSQKIRERLNNIGELVGQLPR